MAEYNMLSLPLNHEEVLRRLADGEEFVLYDEYPTLLYEFASSGPAHVPVIFYPEGREPDFRISFRNLPCACQNSDRRNGLPNVFIYVPLKMLTDVPENEIRFLIAREYMYSMLPNGFYRLTDEMGTKAQMEYASSKEMKQYERQCSFYALMTIGRILDDDEASEIVCGEAINRMVQANFAAAGKKILRTSAAETVMDVLKKLLEGVMDEFEEVRSSDDLRTKYLQKPRVYNYHQQLYGVNPTS